jgi:HD-GYP domain-containing protein (c-di-GMP phosphodiesterase class II)
MEDPDDKKLFDLTVESLRRYIEFLYGEAGALSAILQIENPDGNPAHHGVSVASLALALCRKTKVTDLDTLNAVMLGCLLHDIEYFYSGLPLKTNVEKLPSAERKPYHRLPELGHQRLKNIGFYPDLSLNLVLQMEELMDGSGYPANLKEDEIAPLVSLAGLCNAFDRYVGLNGIPMKDALKSILIDRMGRHPLKCFQALQDVLKEDGLI